MVIDGKFVAKNVNWIDKTIPGGADRTFVLGMTETLFRTASMESGSRELANKQFNEVAVYFDKVSKNSILCSFEDTGQCEGSARYPENSFSLNKDVFKKINNFTNLSYMAEGALRVLILAFAVVVTISLSFAMNSEVKSQERSLAILRAFGVSAQQLSLFFQLRTLIHSFYALLLASTVYLLISSTLLNRSELSSISKNIDLTLSGADLIWPIITILLLTQISTAFVVLAWGYRNRYVADKLQGL